MQPFETPSTQLSGERSKIGLTEVFGDHLFNKKLLVVHFPRTTVWLIEQVGRRDTERERERERGERGKTQQY